MVESGFIPLLLRASWRTRTCAFQRIRLSSQSLIDFGTVILTEVDFLVTLMTDHDLFALPRHHKLNPIRRELFTTIPVFDVL
jgi:hypothetical protein